jgi:glycosyltransferase involved in cell wall biosynthesis
MVISACEYTHSPEEMQNACGCLLGQFELHFSIVGQHVHPQHRLRVKILFTSTLNTSFIREDLVLLRKHFDVDHLLARGWTASFRIVAHAVAADVTYTWFASVYSFIAVLAAKVFGKKSIIIIGGVDASKEPSINYGIWLTPWKAALVTRAMRQAHKLLIVDPFFRDEIIRLARYDGANIEYVPTGYDSERWTPGTRKEPFVLTVAACQDEDKMKKKGLDLLFASARSMPETHFVVIGVLPHLLKKARVMAPPNVEILPFVEQSALIDYYQRAKVYCQPSFTEGLPNSICEAMLCECIPVGTRVGGIPTAISDCGYLVEYGDASALTAALRQALADPVGRGDCGRTYIAREFPLTRREEALVRILKEAVS